MKRGPTLWAMLAVIAVMAPAMAAAEPDYAIKLTRPEKAGNEFRIAAVTSQTIASMAKTPGKADEQRTDTATVTLDAAVKVLEVDKNGTPSKITLTVDKLTVKKNEAAAAELLVKGTVVTASVKDGASVFEVEGKAVTPEKAMALAMVVTLGEGQAADDETFGTKDRKKVGDQWPINAELASKEMAKKGMGVAKEDLTGTVKLEGAVKVGAVECLDIRARMVGKKFSTPPAPGFKTQDGSIEVAFAAKLPVDPAARSLEQSMDMTAKTVATGKLDPQGPDVTIDSTIKISSTVKFSAAK
jgi:hypothetical protein